jgi:hypothetical protein
VLVNERDHRGLSTVEDVMEFLPQLFSLTVKKVQHFGSIRESYQLDRAHHRQVLL